MVERMFGYAVKGAFGGMVFAALVLAGDVSAIGTMLKGAEGSLLVNLFLAGSMLKGSVIGMAIGTTMLGLRKHKSSRS
ncbi:MAG: hypothetical protein HC834_10255 [Rhodospirillales bacterium]|nr:hypothetical protein [Rhodospirillales bacterium]